MPDYNAIATALAARYAPGQVTPPAGYGNIRTATAAPPNAMPSLPAVIVFHESSEFDYFPSKRDSGHDFAIHFYFAEAGDIARHTTALNKWLTVLVDQLRASTQLGGTVTLATITNAKSGQMSYGGRDYAGVILTAHVVVNEAWSAVA